MKTLRFTAAISCFLILLLLLTSCSGFNAQMRTHLSDKTNYHSFRGTICDVYYFDAENKKVSLLASDEFPESDVRIELAFENYDTVKTFLGSALNPEWSLNAYRVIFEITAENSRILNENGFYDAITANTPIEITASSYIYMDANYFFIAAVTYNKTEYLRFENGIQNIREYINKHRSLL